MILFENREKTSEGKTKVPVWFYEASRSLPQSLSRNQKKTLTL